VQDFPGKVTRYRIALEQQAYDLSTINLRLADGRGGLFGDGVSYAYVTSLMGTRLTGDPRDVALRDALYSAIPGLPGAVERRVDSD